MLQVFFESSKECNMAAQLIPFLFFSMLICQAFCCQPAPTTTQQVRTLVADPVINAPRLINVNPAQVPLPAASGQSLFDLLKIPLPTLPAFLQPTTATSPSNETEALDATNSTTSIDDLLAKNSTSLELEADSINGTESSGDLAKELAQAEKAMIASFNKSPSDVATGGPALKLFAAPLEKDKCETSTITAITIMPYDERLIGMDLDRIHEQIKLLESYTQHTLVSFGEFSEEVTNIDGKFALRFNTKHLKESTKCIDLRQFCTKAVSYSREIEKIQFTCQCEPMWIIAKHKPNKADHQNIF